MKTLKQGIFLCFITFAFWGVLYPQFSLVEETYEYVESKSEISRKKNPKEDFIAILNAEAGELQFRSRFWEMWKETAEKN